MMLFHAVWIVAVLSTALTAGLVFTFNVVVMPGLASLPDRDFLQAFKAMDAIVQGNDPRFMVVWVASVISLVAAVPVGMAALSSAVWGGLLALTVVFILGAHLPTVRINVPLNNRIKRLDIGALSIEQARRERSSFEATWNRWNAVRTVVSVLVLAALLIIGLII